MKATVSGIVEDLKFQISEGSDRNWCFPDPAQLKFIYSEKATKFLRNLHLFLTGSCLSLAETANKAEAGKLQFWSESSEILNLRSSNTPETVDFTPP